MISNYYIRLLLITWLCLILISPLGVFYAKNYLKFEISLASLLSHQQFKLDNSPYSQALVFNYLEEQLSEGECVLVFRQAEIAYYQSKCTVSYLDPRLIDAYKANSKIKAMQVLRNLNVSHIGVPVDYGMAEINHSSFSEILNDQLITKIVVDTESIRLYEIEYDAIEANAKQKKNQRQFSHTNINSIGGRLAPKQFYTGGGTIFSPPKMYNKNLFNQKTEILVDAELTGDGFIRLMRVDYEKILNSEPSEWILRPFLVWEGLVEGSKSIKARIIRPKNSSKLFRFSVQTNKSQVHSPIKFLETKYEDAAGLNDPKWQRALEKSWLLWSNPERSYKYVDWGDKSSDEKVVIGGTLPNDRPYYVGKLLQNAGMHNWLQLTANVTGIKPEIYVQWLSERKPQIPFIYKLEKNWFGLRDNSDIEKAMGGSLLKHSLANGFDSKYVAKTQLLDEFVFNTPLCIKVPKDINSARVVFTYSRNADFPATSLRKFGIDNFTATYSGTNTCSQVN